MGRVNSLHRFQLATSFGFDSADGTYLAFGPTINLERLTGWLADVRPAWTPSPPGSVPRESWGPLFDLFTPTTKEATPCRADSGTSPT
jgi:hypothetical protein